MAVAQRLIQHADGLATLRELLELAKNPKAIVEAHETARAQIKMTEAEEAKMNEARAFMGQYLELSNKFDQEKAALEKDKTEHLENIQNFNFHVLNENSRIEQFSSSLATQQTALNDSIKQHEENKRLLERDKNAAAAALKLREDAITKREADAKRKEDTLAAEDERLATFKENLNKKARLVTEAISM